MAPRRPEFSVCACSGPDPAAPLNLVAEGLNHQVGSAVQDLGTVEEIGRRVDEATEPDHAHHLVEIAERGLDLRQKVDAAAARRGVALLDGDAGAELALGDQFALRVETNLTRHEKQISGADETDIVRHRACGFVQDNALCRKFLLDRTRHGSSPFEWTLSRPRADRAALFRASRLHMQVSGIGAAMPKNRAMRAANSYFFVKWP